MRELADPFCPVCAEAIRVKLSTFDPAVAVATLPRPQGGNTMPDLTPDAVVAAIDNEAVVSLEGYVVDSTQWQDRIELVTDPWLRDRLIIDRLNVVHPDPRQRAPLERPECPVGQARCSPLLRVVTVRRSSSPPAIRRTPGPEGTSAAGARRLRLGRGTRRSGGVSPVSG